MAAGRKPDITIKFKAVDAGKDGKEVSFAAFWREDNGRLSGGLDRKVTKVRIEFSEGPPLEVTRANGKVSHWCNLKDWSAGGGGRARSAPSDAGDDEPF